MQPGAIDLIILILIFIGLQSLWLIPIIKKNNKLNEKVGEINEEISEEIKLPRMGHIMVMTGFSDSSGTTFPQPQASGMLYVDVGNSKNIRPMYTQSGTGADGTTNVGNSIVARSSHTDTVSDCDDDKITIMPGTVNQTIRICNRESNSAFVFYLTFL